MRLDRARAWTSLLLTLFLSACGGGGGGTSTLKSSTLPPTTGGGAGTAAAATTVTVSSAAATTATLPAIDGIGASMTLPRVASALPAGTATLTVAAGTRARVVPPLDLSRLRALRAAGTPMPRIGAFMELFYVIVRPAVTITFQGLPRFSIQPPPSIGTSGRLFFYVIANIEDVTSIPSPPAANFVRSPPASNVLACAGPARVNGQTLAFDPSGPPSDQTGCTPPSGMPLTLAAGTNYLFDFYAFSDAPTLVPNDTIAFARNGGGGPSQTRTLSEPGYTDGFTIVDRYSTCLVNTLATAAISGSIVTVTPTSAPSGADPVCVFAIADRYGGTSTLNVVVGSPPTPSPSPAPSSAPEIAFSEQPAFMIWAWGSAGNAPQTVTVSEQDRPGGNFSVVGARSTCVSQHKALISINGSMITVLPIFGEGEQGGSERPICYFVIKGSDDRTATLPIFGNIGTGRGLIF